MHAERISLALTRIETAASRIREAARGDLVPPAEPGSPDVEARYEALRQETTSALAELDQLIARLES